MTPKLSDELSAAIDASDAGILQVVHPGTNRMYVVVDEETHRKAMDALRKREDLEAIQAGIDDMEAGRTLPAEEAHRQGREQLLARYQA